MNKLKSTFGLAAGLALLSSGAFAQQTTLNIAAFANYDMAIRHAIPAFEAKYPDVKVNLVALSFQDHHTAMTTSLSTGANIPDVMAIEVSFMGRFSNAGGFEDLNQAPYNFGEYAEKFSPFSVQLGQSTKNEQAGVPVDIGPGALFYHNDVLVKAGVTEDQLTKDWDSFIEAGKTIKEKTGSYLISSAADLKDLIIRSGLKDGEGIYFDENGKVAVESDRFKEAFRVAKAARDAGLDADLPTWSNEWGEALRRGDVTTQMMGSWMGGNFHGWIAPGQNVWRTADLPNNAYASWGGSFLTIPKRAEQKEAAWNFIQFMSLNPELQVEIFDQLDIFPSLIEAQQSELMAEPVEYLGNQLARLQWSAAAAKIPALKVHRHDPIAEQIINDALDTVLLRGTDINKALADAAKQIKRRARR